MVTPVCILIFDFARVFVSVTRHSLLRTCKIFQKRTNKSTRVLKTATTTTVWKYLILTKAFLAKETERY